jgi:hypothetical protein
MTKNRELSIGLEEIHEITEAVISVIFTACREF